MRILAISAACLLVVPSVFAQEDADTPSIADLDFFIGEWEGRSTLFFPYDEEREPIREETSAVCKYILKETYIQCDTAWTRTDGRTRTFRLHLNYNEEEGGYQTLFIYDNWPGIANYALKYEAAADKYVGFTDFENDDGETVGERIVWRVSSDRNEIRSEEFHHTPSDSEGAWSQTFEFVWRRRE